MHLPHNRKCEASANKKKTAANSLYVQYISLECVIKLRILENTTILEGPSLIVNYKGELETLSDWADRNEIDLSTMTQTTIQICLVIFH